jgi:hypothetical protein
MIVAGDQLAALHDRIVSGLLLSIQTRQAGTVPREAMTASTLVISDQPIHALELALPVLRAPLAPDTTLTGQALVYLQCHGHGTGWWRRNVMSVPLRTMCQLPRSSTSRRKTGQLDKRSRSLLLYVSSPNVTQLSVCTVRITRMGFMVSTNYYDTLNASILKFAKFGDVKTYLPTRHSSPIARLVAIGRLTGQIIMPPHT